MVIVLDEPVARTDDEGFAVIKLTNPTKFHVLYDVEVRYSVRVGRVNHINANADPVRLGAMPGGRATVLELLPFFRFRSVSV